MACCKGPGYATPMDAMKNGKREELVYIPCIIPPQRRDKRPDYLATVDVNPESPDYCKVIHRLNLPYLADEVHHTGWNACSSCHDDESKVRNRLNMPCINTSRIYVIDTGTDIRAPRLFRIVEPSEMFERAGLSTPHTTHCLANGEVMISCMGDPQGNTKECELVQMGVFFQLKAVFMESWSVTLHTDLGDLKIELFCEQCPMSTENFLALCGTDYYNNCVFHRNIKGFMLQTGDPLGEIFLAN